jgi:hypothetical protein
MLPFERMRRSIADALLAVNLAATAAAACVGWPARAGAHPEFAPSTVNHYVKFDLVAPDEVRLAYTVMVGATPAAAWRRAVDANADGKIDDDEAKALGEQARKAVAEGVALTADGTKVMVAFEEPVVGLAGAEVAPSPFSVDLVARVKLAGAGKHTVRFEDATVEPQLGETEVRVEESPATQLVASHRGAEGTEKETRFLFRGQKFSALEDRSVTFVWGAAAKVAAAKAPSEVVPASRWLLAPVGIVMALVGFAGATVMRRRARERGAGKGNGNGNGNG